MQPTIAVLQAMQGRFREARDLIAEVPHLLEELGLDWTVPLIKWDCAEIDRLAEDWSATERELRVVYETHRQHGDQGHLSSSAFQLAEVLVEQGHDDEALRLTQISEAAADLDDVDAQVGWRCVRPRVLARRGSIQEAERLARAAVELAEQTDWLEGHGDALMSLAEVLSLAGRPQEAAATVHQALKLYDQKGNLVLAAKARSLPPAVHHQRPAATLRASHLGPGCRPRAEQRHPGLDHADPWTSLLARDNFTVPV